MPSPRRCSQSWPRPTWPCTGSPTRRGCCARPTSATRSTATPGSAVTTPLAAYAEAFAELRALDDELGELTTRSRERAQEADLLHFGLDGDRGRRSTAGRGDSAAAEEDRLANADTLRTAAAGAHDALLGAGDGPEGADAAALVAAAQSSLAAAGAHDQALAALASRLSELGYLLTDVAR